MVDPIERALIGRFHPLALCVIGVAAVCACGGDDDETALVDIDRQEIAARCARYEREFAANAQAVEGFCRLVGADRVVDSMRPLAAGGPVPNSPEAIAQCESNAKQACPDLPPQVCLGDFSDADCNASLEDMDECHAHMMAFWELKAELTCKDALMTVALRGAPVAHPETNCERVWRCFPRDFFDAGGALP